LEDMVSLSLNSDPPQWLSPGPSFLLQGEEEDDFRPLAGYRVFSDGRALPSFLPARSGERTSLLLVLGRPVLFEEEHPFPFRGQVAVCSPLPVVDRLFPFEE